MNHPAPSITLILDLLHKFTASRSRIDFRNYADRESAMGDYRTILRHGKDARVLLRHASTYLHLMPEIERGLRAGQRLSLVESGGKTSLEYCTGQYFPTEYRAAVCRLLAGAICSAWRQEGWDRDAIERKARAYFGRGIANRWFK